MSPEGVEAPHQAHNDSSMGRWSCMLYVNREEHCQGGTSLVKHIETGVYRSPTEEQLEILHADSNNPDKWEVVDMCEMFPNRALVFDSEVMHRAEPTQGFGTTQKDARMVVTVFFS